MISPVIPNELNYAELLVYFNITKPEVDTLLLQGFTLDQIKDCQRNKE